MSQYCADLEWAPDWINEFQYYGRDYNCLTCWEVSLEEPTRPIFIYTPASGESLVSVLKALDAHVENVHYGPDAYEGD